MIEFKTFKVLPVFFSSIDPKQIELMWEKGQITPNELIGHDDHVVTCLQFDGNRIVSGSDDNTLKVSLVIFS